MDWNTFAPMLVMITAILTAGGVLVLRPLSKRVAELLEVLVKRERGLPAAEVAQLRELLATLEGRLALLEERQEFTDSLLASAGEGQSSPPAEVRLASAGDGRSAPLPAAAAARLPAQGSRS